MSRPTSILVTGGLGFVGKAIVTALAEAHPQYKIFVLDIQSINDATPPRTGVEYLQGDIRKAHEVANAVEWAEPDVIVHTAGWVPGMNSRYRRRVQDVHNITKLNVGGTLNVLEAAKENGVRALVYTSSYTVVTDDLDHDYPNMKEDMPVPPKSLIYGESKVRYRTMEHYSE